MADSVHDVVRDQIRGVTGALLVVGLAVLYTSEMWWLARRLPIASLVGYAAVGLAVVLVLTRAVGFRRADGIPAPRGPLPLATAFSELVLQSFVAAYVVLLVLGVLTVGDSVDSVVRQGLVHVVPLGLGAAIANRLLAEPSGEIQEATFPGNLPTFVLGATFFSFPVAPTREVQLIAARADWWHLAALVALSVVVVQLVLHELEFRGQSSRIESRSALAQLGTTCIVYLTSLVVSVVLLVSFGHFTGSPPLVWVQQTIVLAFVAATGASAGEVVL